MLRRLVVVSAVLSLCLLVLCGLLAGCGGGGGGGQSSGEAQVIGGGQTTITGQVVDATSVTSPIPDAYVYVPLSPPTQPSAHRAVPSQVIASDITDQQGNYRLQNVPGGTLTMVVEPPETSNYNGVQLDINAPDAGEIYVRVTLLPKTLSVMAVFVDPPSVSLFTGDKQRFTATVLDSSGQQTNAAVVWLVTGGVGEIDNSGLFTALAPGSGRVVAIAGQEAGSATVQVAPRASSISGRVTSAQSGGGIPGATVTVDGKSTTTDSQGAYTVSGLAAGQYTVTAYANGYVQASVQVTLAEGEGGTADISLEPTAGPPPSGTGAIAGKVTDGSTGEPIQGATVSAGSKSVTTDSDGNYTISNLSPGDYTVTASKSGYTDASTTVTVQAGKTVTANTALTPEAPTTGSISGIVTDASTGKSIQGATVSTGGKSATTDSDGNYTISNLSPGDYTVTASAVGYVAGSTQATVSSGQTTTIDFALQPQTGSISGTVTDASSGAWIEGATVSAGGKSATTDSDGNYTISNLSPGDYTVTVSATDYVEASVQVTVVAGRTTTADIALNPVSSPYEKWRFTTGNYIESSPAIGADGTIYVGSQDDNLYAINPDGSEKWRFTTGDYIRSSPAIGADGTIYVGSADHNLYAINPDGSEKWRFTTGYYIGSSPAIGADGTIYVGSWDHNLYAINPDGSEKWCFTTGDYIGSSPAIGADGTIYVGSRDCNLYAINPDGSEKWRFTTGSGIWSSSPAIGADGTIYVGSDDYNLYAINLDGSEKWRFTTGSGIWSSPAIGADGTIYVGSADHNLYAINPDGSEKWRFITGSGIRSSPAIGADGTIYVGSYDDNLYAIGVHDYTPQLADTPWPMFRHDIRHTGRYGYVPRVGRFLWPW